MFFQVCRRVIISKMMNPDSVRIGVILFGTKVPDKTFNAPKGVTTLLTLTQPNIDAIHLLQNVVSGECY